MEAPSRPSPTTDMPTTPPVRKAIRAPAARPLRSPAAAATRTLARTASHMPRYPMAAEKPAPSRKKTDRPTRIPVSPGSRNSSPNTTAAKSTRVRNIRLRYAAAPSWTAWAISCMRGVPSCAASTCRRRTSAKASETTPMTAITLTVTRLEVPSEGIRPPCVGADTASSPAARGPLCRRRPAVYGRRVAEVWAGPGGVGPHPSRTGPRTPTLPGHRASCSVKGDGPDVRTRRADPPSPTRRITMAAWEQSLQELVRTRGTALVGYAYLLCGDRREAEDLVQDALVKTYARGRVG